VAIASQIYALLARLRRTRAETTPGRTRRLSRPVVSIGNLSVGGSGKTPLTALVARLLAEAGERPAVLSRGYARTHPDDGVTIVSDGHRLRADLARAGDEPLLLARALPGVAVLVCADRFLAGRLAEQHLGATVHVLDDGFQHMQLARDVNLLIVDRADVDRPLLLPSGSLREPLSAARAADAVMITGAEDADAAGIGERLGVATAFSLHRDVEPAVEETMDGPRPLEPGARVLLLSGIARPQRFLSEAVRDGFDVAFALKFGDHHPFNEADVARISHQARAVGASFVLTTEKDFVRLLPLRPWPFRLAVRPMTVRVEPADQFAAWLLEQVRGGRASARQSQKSSEALQSSEFPTSQSGEFTSAPQSPGLVPPQEPA
jgi:tetraacyldisaccharide 4'-kinase